MWLCLCSLSSCRTSHTISRAELHRTSEHIVHTDSLATHTAVSDSTVRNIAVLDSTVITHIIETIITNTVDASGNLLDTKTETNRTTNRDHNRTVTDQTSNKHNEQTDTAASSITTAERNDSVADTTIIHDPLRRRSFWEIAFSSICDGIMVLSVILLLYVIIYYSYLYIKGK